MRSLGVELGKLLPEEVACLGKPFRNRSPVALQVIDDRNDSLLLFGGAMRTRGTDKCIILLAKLKGVAALRAALAAMPRLGIDPEAISLEPSLLLLR